MSFQKLLLSGNAPGACPPDVHRADRFHLEGPGFRTSLSASIRSVFRVCISRVDQAFEEGQANGR